MLAVWRSSKGAGSPRLTFMNVFPSSVSMSLARKALHTSTASPGESSKNYTQAMYGRIFGSLGNRSVGRSEEGEGGAREARGF